MSSFNKILLMGNLTRNPELRYVASGTAVASFGLAVNNKFKNQAGNVVEETMFIDVIVWGITAENCTKHLTKGSNIFVEGELKQESWVDKESGQKRVKHVVKADSVRFLSFKKDGAPEVNNQPEQPEI